MQPSKHKQHEQLCPTINDAKKEMSNNVITIMTQQEYVAIQTHFTGFNTMTQQEYVAIQTHFTGFRLFRRFETSDNPDEITFIGSLFFSSIINETKYLLSDLLQQVINAVYEIE